MRFLLAVLFSVTMWVPFVATYSIWVENPRDVMLLIGSLLVNGGILWIFMKLERADPSP